MNVHLDVLELVFAELGAADLAAAALVSRAFLAGARPALYADIEYTTRHAKRALQMPSPFAALAAHAHLPVHVRRIALYDAPVLHPAAHQPCPAFLRDLAAALAAATNLRAFVCTPKIIAPLLPALPAKERLAHVRLAASLGTRQVAVLAECAALRSLALDYPSWNTIDALPRWAGAMQRTLAHLTLFMTQEIDAAMLRATLAQLPRLRGLHVISCPRITHTTVLRALGSTPDLRELSLTVFPSRELTLPPLNFAIPPITHLSLDIRTSYPSLKALIARIIARISPRDALAICGSWIGEINGSTERTDPPQNDAPGGPNFPVIHGHVHLGFMPPPAHAQAPGQAPPNNVPFFPPNPNQHAGPVPPNPGNQMPFIGFPFPFPPDGGGAPGPDPPAPDPEHNPEQDSPLIPSLPSTLSVLHIPQVSPTGLKEIVDQCPSIQVLGIVMGASFNVATPKTSDRRSATKAKPALNTVGVKPEINTLANILSRARALRELIVDTSATALPDPNPGPSSDSKGGPALVALLTPLSVRLMMRESPCLRRIVGEGRVWQSSTPVPTCPVPFPRCLDIELTLTKARYGPGASNTHAHGLPGFGMHSGGRGQMEGSNDHWFWLKGSGSLSHTHGRS